MQKSPLSSDTIGQGNTSAWKMCGLDKKTSLCFVYDITRKVGPDSSGSDNLQASFYLWSLW